MAKREIVDMLSRLSPREIEGLALRAGIAASSDPTDAIVSHYRKPDGVYDMRRFAKDVITCPRVERAVHRLVCLK